MSDLKLHFVITKSDRANALRSELILRYGNTQPCDATHIVAVGGDGTALSAWHCALWMEQRSRKTLPVYAINCGARTDHRGILTNPRLQSIASLGARIAEAEPMRLHPMQADCAMAAGGRQDTFFGFNEIAVRINMYGTACLSAAIVSDAMTPVDEFSVVGDGILMATPIGASAYYKNAGGRTLAGFGPMQELDAAYLAGARKFGIQTICGRPPRNEVIPDTHQLHVRVCDSEFRPTCVMRDDGRVSPPIVSARIFKARTPISVLWDRERS
ncbi:MAG: hypothetical protein PHX68_00285 [Alphaproteobacteria bacterium]|nr:hypothetical protein [Alphaproteobacteria bacterium]